MTAILFYKQYDLIAGNTIYKGILQPKIDILYYKGKDLIIFDHFV